MFHSFFPTLIHYDFKTLIWILFSNTKSDICNINITKALGSHFYNSKHFATAPFPNYDDIHCNS